MKHNYTLSGDLPEMVQAKLNAMNLSEVQLHQSVQSAAFVYKFSHIQLSLCIYCACAFSEPLQTIMDQDT